MAIRFGLQIPSFSFPRAGERGVFEVTREIAQRAEAEGFDSIWFQDHLIQLGALAPVTDPILDCWTGLAALASCTERVRLGTLVAAAGFRPPSILAKLTSSLDVISGGRLVVGLGAGWRESEHRAYGLPFPPIGERLERLEETLQILRAMWTEERAHFEGRHFSIDGAICSPKPVQRPHPPLLIGGSGRRVTLRLAAQYAAMHNIGVGDVAECRHVLAALREHCDRLGRDSDSIEKSRLTPILFADSAADAERRADALRPAGESAERFRSRTTMGTPESVAEQLAAYAELGIETFIVSFWDVDDLTPLETLMREVAPRLCRVG